MRWVVFAVSSFLLHAQSIQLVRVASGIPNPTEIETPRSDGSGRLFVNEQRGRIRIIRNGSVLSAPFLDISGRVSCCSERGLLGLAFPPGFVSSQRFYVYYTDPQGTITISRFRVSAANPDQADPASEEVVLKVPHPGAANHNGGRLTFGPDGFLYAGLGDGGGGGDPNRNGQNLQALLGKILRIDVEGSVGGTYTVPSSNPFVTRAGARPEIWAYGLRNPWRFSFDGATGDLWIADVGQDAWEEINLQSAGSSGGQNYGWNITEGTHCYPASVSNCNRDGLTMPIAEYGHNLGVSITGGYLYRGNAVPSLRGAYVYADYGSGRIWALRSEAQRWFDVVRTELLLESRLEISAFGLDQDGELYLGSYGEGAIYRFAAVSSGPSVSVVNAASFADGLVPGSLASAFGSGIAPIVGIVQATAFPLPTQLGGVSVTMNGTPVPVLGVASVRGQDQVNFQIPFELAGQTTARVVLTVNGRAGTPVDVALQSAQPEMFVVQQQPLAWTLWATGLGPVTNAPGTGQPAPSSPLARLIEQDVRVTIGGIDAPVFYAGLSPGFAGLYQVNVTPPPGVAADAPVVLRIRSAASRPWQLPVR